MFIETAVALFALGFLFGATIVYLIGCQPYARENEALRLRLVERRFQDEQNAHEYRKHLGTPYLPRSLPPELSDAIEAVVDDHNASRRALEVVS